MRPLSTHRTAGPRAGGAAVSSVPFPPGSAPFPARSSGLAGSRPRPLLAGFSQPLEPERDTEILYTIRLPKLSLDQQICIYNTLKVFQANKKFFRPKNVYLQSAKNIFWPISVSSVCQKFLQTNKYVSPMRQSFSRLTHICLYSPPKVNKYVP